MNPSARAVVFGPLCPFCRVMGGCLAVLVMLGYAGGCTAAPAAPTPALGDAFDVLPPDGDAATSTPDAPSGQDTSDHDGSTDRGALPDVLTGSDAPDGDVSGSDTQMGEDTGPSPAVRKVLLVIIDDFGIDSALAWGDVDGDGQADDGRNYAPMPNFQGICQAGVQFDAAWSAPTCSPTRASILTGRFGFRTGIGAALAQGEALPSDELTLPSVLKASVMGLATANIGKWHLGVNPQVGGKDAPRVIGGWDHYAGAPGGTLPAYSEWDRVVDGVEATTTTYATSANVDDAIAWLQGVPSESPWLLWLAFNAPHAPWHVPPPELHDYDQLATDPLTIEDAPNDHYRAALQSLDTELGRLLAWLVAHGHDDVDIIVLGDNGTPKKVMEEPWKKARSKGTLFQGGIHVPMCVSGPSVAEGGRRSDALVQVTDIFATMLDLFDVPAPATTLDGISFASVLTGEDNGLRTWSYSETFGVDITEPGRAVRNATYKLIVADSGEEWMYNLLTHPLETQNILNQTLDVAEQAAYDELKALLDTLTPGAP